MYILNQTRTKLLLKVTEKVFDKKAKFISIQIFQTIFINIMIQCIYIMQKLISLSL